MNTVFRQMCLAILIAQSLVQAHAADSEPPVFELFSLQAEVQGEVVNDLLTTDLVAESEDRNSASLANRINANMQWALSELKRFPTIEAATRNYSTWPRYERKTNRIVGWHATQTLHIESEDFDAARKAIQILQERLLVRNMRLEPKPETRSEREDELIAAALDRFKERAVIVQENMGAANFRIVDVNINTSQHSLPGNPRYEIWRVPLPSTARRPLRAAIAGSVSASTGVSSYNSASS